MRWFLLISLSLSSTKAEIHCRSSLFHIESENVVEGEVLLEKQSDSFEKCLDHCIQNELCSGVNFLLDVHMNPQCLLMDTSKPSTASQLPIGDHVLYAARKYCAPSPVEYFCPNRKWSFEKFPHRDITDSKFILTTRIVEEATECLNLCMKTEGCLAAFHNKKSGECKLSVATLQAVYSTRKFFHFDKDVDMYENNCVQQPDFMTNCNFLTMKSAGVLDHYDARVFGVSDATACERECVMRVEKEGICRMFTFDASTNTCYLSHSTARVLGRNPLEMNHNNLTTGELDDCIEFALKCKTTSLELHATSMKLFAGQLKTKKGKEVLCLKNISANFDFDLEIPYDGCGIQKYDLPSPSYSGLLYLKEGSTELVTIRDKVIQVHCRIHNQVEIPDQTLSFHMQVANGNNSRPPNQHNIILPASTRAPPPVPKPKYSLHVMKSGEMADRVLVGESGHLLITINQADGLDFSVRNLVAQDVNQLKSYKLIDENGCVIDREVITGISRSNPNELLIDIQFSGFPHQSEVVYQALVEPCSYNCFPSCNDDLVRGKFVTSERSFRSRRSSTNGRQIEISQDVYKIRGGRVRLLNPIMMRDFKISEGTTRAYDEKLLSDSQKVQDDVHITEVDAEPLLVTLSRCVSEDTTCLFTLMLACLQLLLLVSCVFIVFFYVKQWRIYRRSRHDSQPISRDVQYEYNGDSQQK